MKSTTRNSKSNKALSSSNNKLKSNTLPLPQSKGSTLLHHLQSEQNLDITSHAFANSASANKLHVEEKSTKPPGVSKFTRKKLQEINNASTLFDATSGANRLPHDQFTASDICQQLLVGGYVQSYTDFYYLTHRLDPNIVQPTPIFASFRDMGFLRDHLVTAELSRRQGNATGVYTPYNSLAEHYSNKSDWKTCIYFYQKYLEMTRLTSDTRTEMRALHMIGIVYQRMHDNIQAIKFHEMHEELARKFDVIEEVKKSNIELYKVYNLLAEKYENEKDTENASLYYHKCQDSAKASWDKHAEGEACGKIGSLLVQKGCYEESIPYLQSFSFLAGETGSTEGKCRASGYLAVAFDSLGRTEEAMIELKQVQSISEQVGDALLQLQAYKALGIMQSKLQHFQEAVDLFEKHYVLVKSFTTGGSNYVATNNTNNGNNTNSTTAGGGTGMTEDESHHHDHTTDDEENHNNNIISSKTKNITTNNTATSSSSSPNKNTNKNTINNSSSSSTTATPTHHDLDMARVYVGISRGNLMMKTMVSDLFLNHLQHLVPLLDWKIYRKDTFLQHVEGDEENNDGSNNSSSNNETGNNSSRNA